MPFIYGDVKCTFNGLMVISVYMCHYLNRKRRHETKINGTNQTVILILDSDFSAINQTNAKYINRVVKRNLNCFSEEFIFQITETESEILTSHFVMLKDYVASELLGVLKVKPASEIIRFAKKVSSLYNHIYEI